MLYNTQQWINVFYYIMDTGFTENVTDFVFELFFF